MAWRGYGAKHEYLRQKALKEDGEQIKGRLERELETRRKQQEAMLREFRKVYVQAYPQTQSERKTEELAEALGGTTQAKGGNPRWTQ